MIIPDPQFKPVNVNLSGLSFCDKVKEIWSNPPRFELCADWIVTLDDGLEIIVTKGFITDFASIPRLLWAVPGFAPSGPLLWGAILHDFGYQYGYLLAVPSSATLPFPEASLALHEKYKSRFGEYVPAFAGYRQAFFDNLMSGVTIEKTGARFIANSARKALEKFGHHAWNKYRIIGPTAFNSNSLGMPGITMSGVAF